MRVLSLQHLSVSFELLVPADTIFQVLRQRVHRLLQAVQLALAVVLILLLIELTVDGHGELADGASTVVARAAAVRTCEPAHVRQVEEHLRTLAALFRRVARVPVVPRDRLAVGPLFTRSALDLRTAEEEVLGGRAGRYIQVSLQELGLVERFNADNAAALVLAELFLLPRQSRLER